MKLLLVSGVAEEFVEIKLISCVHKSIIFLILMEDQKAIAASNL